MEGGMCVCVTRERSPAGGAVVQVRWAGRAAVQSPSPSASASPLPATRCACDAMRGRHAHMATRTYLGGLYQ